MSSKLQLDVFDKSQVRKFWWDEELHTTTKTNKQKRKNYAQIGRASEQCYRIYTPTNSKKHLLTSVNIKLRQRTRWLN